MNKATALIADRCAKGLYKISCVPFIMRIKLIRKGEVVSVRLSLSTTEHTSHQKDWMTFI